MHQVVRTSSVFLLEVVREEKCKKRTSAKNAPVSVLPLISPCTLFPIPPTGFVPRPPTCMGFAPGPHGDASPQTPSFVEYKKILK